MEEIKNDIENIIRDIETAFDSGYYDEKDTEKYKNLVREFKEKIRKNSRYVSPTDSYLMGDFVKGEYTLGEYRFNQYVHFVKSRLLELQAVIAFADDEPSKAKDYILLASQKLRKDDVLCSQLGNSFDILDFHKSVITTDKLKGFAITGFWILLIVVGNLYVLLLWLSG